MMQTRKKHESFEDFLVNSQLVSKAQLEKLGAEIKDLDPEGVRDILFDNCLLSEEEGARAIADFYEVPFINLKQTTFDPLAVEKVSVEFAISHNLVPLLLVDNELSVATSSMDFSAMDSLKNLTGCDVLMNLATTSQVLEALDVQYFTLDLELTDNLIKGIKSSSDEHESSGMKELSRALIVLAIKARASDIHIEAQEDFARIRYRIDGILHEEQRLPSSIHAALVARYKVMAMLDIAETRRPQDGRITIKLGRSDVDLRVSITPSSYGEKVVLRVLDKSGVQLSLDNMYFSKAIDEGIRNVASSANGVILVTGPTGSGKSTTCYAILNHLNSLERNIVTIENPIEYRLPILTQIQVQHEIGLDFAPILRSVLRQDPDVILVGEIRDLETARIVAEAALTGHLVLSTLHTNDAIQAVLRLIELGVEPFLMAPTIIGVLSQRLVRRICENCSEEYKPSDKELSYFGHVEDGSDVVLHRGVGCELCRQTGYMGRIPVHELAVITDEIRDLIIQRSPTQQIEQAAYDSGYRTMRYDGLKKTLMGLTSLDEVLRVTTSKTDFAQD